MRVIIIDYKVGNYFSLINALKKCNVKFIVSNDEKEIQKSDALILPGVGSFKVGMNNLKELNLVEPINNHFYKKKKILGICLGMQLLFDSSEEFGFTKGLGLIKGNIKKLPKKTIEGKKNIIPNMSWAKIKKNKLETDSLLLKDIDESSFFYFVHSFYAQTDKKENIIAYSNFFGLDFAAAVCEQNTFGTQFHLEKSGDDGIKILNNFFSI